MVIDLKGSFTCLEFSAFHFDHYFFSSFALLQKVQFIGGIFMHATYNNFLAILCVHTFHLLINKMIKKVGKG